METWIQRLFLSAALLALSGFGSSAFAQDDAADDDELGQIITPDIQRREVKEADLDSENFEVGIFFGMLSIEDFGTNPVLGLTFAYHITEDFFVEAAYGSSEAEETSYELLSGGVELLTDDERELTYYNISLGYNFLPGQMHFSDKWTFNTNFYLMIGAGNTEFAANEYFTTNLGAGVRFYGTDWLSLDVSMRAHSFEHDLFGESKSITNFEPRLGVSVFF